MAIAIFQYIDKLFQATRPRKHLVMCVDGVAPRAKMNQQRQRRFRSAEELRKAREEAINKGESVPDMSEVWFSIRHSSGGEMNTFPMTRGAMHLRGKEIEGDFLKRCSSGQSWSLRYTVNLAPSKAICVVGRCSIRIVSLPELSSCGGYLSN